MAIILEIIGFFMLINGLVLSVLSNFNVGVLFTVLLGVFFLLWGIYYKKINEITKRGFLKVVKIFCHLEK